jgi:hypothetical protein
VITQEQLKELLHYCPETGVWTWIVSRGSVRKGDEAGYIKTYPNGKKYRVIRVLRGFYFSHRLAFLYVNGLLPDNDVDHEDGNGLNNRWENIREVTVADNAKNQRLYSNNSSGRVGVHWRKKHCKWWATIRVNGRDKHLGVFTNKEDAIAARKKAEAELGFHPNHGTDRPL